MPARPTTISLHFGALPDPRVERTKEHRLIDILTIGLCAVLCGGEGWTDTATFGRAREPWLRTFLALPHGIPSHDTFGRVFSRLDPEAFERCFLAWSAAVVELSAGRLVAVDGKAIRRSFERGWDRSGMAHLVSAFVSPGGNRLVLGQLAVADRENEIVAIPRLLGLLDLRGAVVT